MPEGDADFRPRFTCDVAPEPRARLRRVLSGCPQMPQNLKPGRLLVLHLEHLFLSGWPPLPQKLVPFGFSEPQFAQSTCRALANIVPPLIARCEQKVNSQIGRCRKHRRCPASSGTFAQNAFVDKDDGPPLQRLPRRIRMLFGPSVRRPHMPDW
jgi:hypothetical protein